jgi:hypothetical protein
VGREYRTISLSRSGRFLAHRVPGGGDVGGIGAGGIDVIDALGTSPRHRVALPDGTVDFACVGEMLWVLADAGGAAAGTPGRTTGTAIHRYLLHGGRPLQPAIRVAAGARRLAPSAGERAMTALVSGERHELAYGLADEVSTTPIDGPGAMFPLTGRHVLAIADELRVIDAGRGALARMAVLEKSTALVATSLFAGRAIAVLTRGPRGAQFVVLHPTRGLLHQIAIPEPRCWAIAENRGLALIAAEGDLVAVDLRYGRIQERHACPEIGERGDTGETAGDIDELAIDADAQFVALAGTGRGGAPVHLPYTELWASARRGSRGAAGPAPENRDENHADHGTAEPDGNGEPPPFAAAPSTAAARPDAADAAPLVEEVPPQPPPVIVPDLVPRALGSDLPPLQIAAPPDAPPYRLAREHVDDLVQLIELRAARAIAEAWNTGQLSRPSEDQRPFEREVLALLGRTGGYATDLLADAEARLAEHTQRTAARAAATIAAGTRLPCVELAREIGLSAIAIQILMVVVAPLIRGEIARLYGVLANDEHRPLVDRFLVEVVIAGADPRVRSEIASELSPDAPLIRFGLVRQAGESPLFAELSVDPVLVDRIRGHDGGGGGATTLRDATRTLAELRLPDELVRELVLVLAEQRRAGAPLRLVLRGRRGAGRHSVIAALAARVGRRVAAIDASRLPRSATRLALGLRLELTRALLRRAVPVVSGLETVDAAGGDGQEAITEVIRTHPGPIVIRTTPEGSLPIEPGHVSLRFPPMSESERTQMWTEALARAGLVVTSVDDLAQRFRIGPGVIERVIAEVTARGEQLPPATETSGHGAAIIAAAGQHIASRLGHVATRVTRLARWEQVAFPEDILDSLKEFIGRVRHRRTVYERWGFDAKMTSSRGLSALFYGPPGTGKSMVAGLIARELGLELYRVDLSRVVSKWIGETEKNLAEVFDAAEDGQVVILFDEADSMFAKRTEVKSSVDRYANLEVNYLLQRLDSFEGICILTTNLEGSIDPAFKRRMTLRLHFPFPDEDMRARLWAAHLPPQAPSQGDFDFAQLAQRFPLSGGYIRNSVLRAAFLAAQEQRPLSQSHLIRAIQLEYRELGKLSTSGRME